MMLTEFVFIDSRDDKKKRESESELVKTGWCRFRSGKRKYALKQLLSLVFRPLVSVNQLVNHRIE